MPLPARLAAASMLLATLCTHDARAQNIDAYNPSPHIYPTSLAMQADGKVVIVGNFLSVGDSLRTRVARLDVDGSVDAGFADPNVDFEVKTVAVQTDGRILIGGSFTQVGGQSRHYLARLNPDGTLDTSFADPDLDSAVWALVVQPDGRILAGGDFTHIGAIAQDYFARFTANGSFDPSFADPQLCCSVVRSVALQADGDVLIGGAFSQVGGVEHFYLARYSGNGVFDPSFPNVPDSVVLGANNIVMAPDGSILLAESGTPSIRKLHADGTLDASFNGASQDGSVNGIVLQPNGKLLIGGTFAQVDGQARHGLARLNADGSLDTSFGDPQFSFDATHPDGSVYGIAAQADGDAVVIGNFTLADNTPRQYMARVVTGDAVVDRFSGQASANAVIVTWARSGAGPELALPPTLMHSSDGVNFSAVGPMTRIANGWQATAAFDVHAAPFYLRAIAATRSGAGNGAESRVASTIWFSDTIFADGFE